MRCVAEVSSFNLMYNLCMYYEKQKSYDKTELTFQPTLVEFCLFGWFLNASSASKLYRGWVLRMTSDNFTCCHTRDGAGRHDFCLTHSHYTDTDPTSRKRESNPGLPHQESRALPTELPRRPNKL